MVYVVQAAINCRYYPVIGKYWHIAHIYVKFMVTSILKKSRIWETKNLSTDADSRTDTILERLRDLSLKKNKK